ncbi:DDHD domain-containing protein [Forsythia ovata]|uniref:DDHD domain-containing protein n=1 Tax=Forsythia ovata TaxID=205694 RepID=A0ABD1W6P7_9LAMI
MTFCQRAMLLEGYLVRSMVFVEYQNKEFNQCANELSKANEKMAKQQRTMEKLKKELESAKKDSDAKSLHSDATLVIDRSLIGPRVLIWITLTIGHSSYPGNRVWSSFELHSADANRRILGLKNGLWDAGCDILCTNVGITQQYPFRDAGHNLANSSHNMEKEATMNSLASSSGEVEQISPDMLKNTDINIRRLADEIQHYEGRQKYLACSSSPSDSGDVRWYLCKVPLGVSKNSSPSTYCGPCTRFSEEEIVV